MKIEKENKFKNNLKIITIYKIMQSLIQEELTNLIIILDLNIKSNDSNILITEIIKHLKKHKDNELEEFINILNNNFESPNINNKKSCNINDNNDYFNIINKAKDSINKNNKNNKNIFS